MTRKSFIFRLNRINVLATILSWSRILIYNFLNNLTDGTAVDPASRLDSITHVYVDGATKYFAILNLTDIQEDKNSYYKIQLLESNDKPRRYRYLDYWMQLSNKLKIK